MLFNSLDFAIFLPIVFGLYWFVVQSNLRLQNWLLLVASYVFYGWWDWRFLSLVFFSTLVDYLVGLGLARHQLSGRRKLLLATSVVVNLGLLGFFKYYNFFVDNFVEAFRFFGMEFEGSSLRIILPVGISFYTFQTLSYSIDVYRRQLAATRSFVEFSAFVTFFPQLVAGPIERATNLLPQFQVPRRFEYSQAVDGTRQILWGLFKKLVIADGCAEYANTILNQSSSYSGSAVALGIFFFAFQIYGDFSGYSDIAIGTGRLFGFRLMKNFAFPYFSRDIAEFWRRWHISLSTWFRDYLYIPLGGSRAALGKVVRNTFIVFVVSGFWHGANWTFVVWGALNALYFMPLVLLKWNRANLDVVAAGRLLPSARELVMVLGTFGLTMLAWLFFRAPDLTTAFQWLGQIASPSLLTLPSFPKALAAFGMLWILAGFLVVEWLGRDREYGLQVVSGIKRPWLRHLCYQVAALLMLLLGRFGDNEFIYFQF